MYVKFTEELLSPSATITPLAIIFIFSLLVRGAGDSREALNVSLSPGLIGIAIISDQLFWSCKKVLTPWFGSVCLPIRGKEGAVMTYSISIHPSNSTSSSETCELAGLSLVQLTNKIITTTIEKSFFMEFVSFFILIFYYINKTVKNQQLN